ncbi:MAG: cohesin domain-containing protein [Ignavibacteriales bacterium]|nr:cohesin domain-containing protein [Ignavibacteriales bacterium]
MRNFKISIVKLLFLGIAMLMLWNGVVSAQVNVTLPTISRQAGSPDEYVGITVGDLTGLNVTAFQFTVYYDKNIIEITEASTVGLAMTGGTDPVFNPDIANGKIVVAWAKATAISGAGTLVNLKIHYKSVGVTSLTTVNPNPPNNNTFLFNAGTPATSTINGQVTIPAISVSFGNVNAAVNDTILIPVITTALSDGNNVRSFDFTATFNKNIIKIIDYVTTGTLGAGGTVSINPNNTAGTVALAWAKATNITGSGVLVYLKAVVLANGVCNVVFTSFQFNAGSPTVATFSGTVTAASIGINGKVTYGSSAVPVANVLVSLTAGGAPVTATTDVNGNYSFTNLTSGSYSVAFTKTTPFGGVNSADALLAARYFANLVVLDTLQKLAGDVNNSGVVNNGDAMLIVQRYVEKITAFDKPDWTFFPANQSVTISNASVVVNAQTLVTGDINKSYNPAGLNKEVSSITLVSDTKSVLQPKESIEVPIQVVGDLEVGALSIRFSYPVNVAKFEAITLSDSRIIAKENNGIISIAWADLTGGSKPMILADKSILATVKFSLKNNVSDGENFGLSLNSESEVVDAKGNTLTMAKFDVPEFSVSVPKVFVLNQNYPNPFNPSTTINYSIPQDGNVTIIIYNVEGQLVSQLFDGMNNAGSHNITWNASNLTSGIYFYKINFNGVNSQFTDTKSMILLK